MSLKPLIMGVLNVTPDSFSDGGIDFSPKDAFERGMRLAAEGADIIDVGGESTRPGADPISTQEEMARVLPVIEQLFKACSARVSIDTRNFEVAVQAVRAGATFLNDVSGGRDIRMGHLVRDHGLDVCLMHMQNDPRTMQCSPVYRSGVVTEVKSFLKDRVRAFEELGIPRERLWVDPGIGFGKHVDHNLDLLRHLTEFIAIGGRLMVGTSRKSFLAHVLYDPSLSFENRREGTIASNLFAYARGASVFRVHEVAALRRALSTWDAILNGTDRDSIGQ